MFDDEKKREDEDELEVEPEDVEDLDASEDEDVKGGMMANAFPTNPGCQNTIKCGSPGCN